VGGGGSRLNAAVGFGRLKVSHSNV
jgi:hypothetical protein